MIRKISLSLALFLLFPFASEAKIERSIEHSFELSEPDSGVEMGISYKGFIRWDGIYSLRQPVGAREGLLYQYAQPPELDASGNDKNATPLINMTSLFSRGAIRFDGPSVNNIDNYAYVEADFFGHLNDTINSLRIRHAFLHLHTHNIHLSFGQRWSIFSAHQYFPGVINPGAGQPLQPFARHPGVYLEWFPNEHFHLRSSVTVQRDAFSEFGAQNKLQQNSGLPIVSGSVNWKPTADLSLGIATMGKAIRPDHVSENLYSGALQAFGEWMIREGLRLRTRAVLGTNLADHQMLGGFVELKDGSYQNLFTTSQWLDIDYKLNSWWSFGIFGGFTANLGMDKTGEAQQFVARSPDQAWSAFIVPRLVYQPAKDLRFALEINNSYSLYASQYNSHLRPEAQIDDSIIPNLYIGLTSMFIF